MVPVNRKEIHHSDDIKEGDLRRKYFPGEKKPEKDSKAVSS